VLPACIFDPNLSNHHVRIKFDVDVGPHRRRTGVPFPSSPVVQNHYDKIEPNENITITANEEPTFDEEYLIESVKKFAEAITE
jgi:hypothetical protein